MADDTSPLLERTSLDEGDDEQRYQEAPSLARIAGALAQGKLPDNNQLFTIFHKSAAFLDGISTSINTSTHTNGDYGNNDDEEGAGVLSDDTAMILGTLLKENSALCRLLAKWIYGEEPKDEQEKAADGDMKGGARGNENEQIQRLLWHSARALSFDTKLPVDVNVDLPVDVQKAKEGIQEGAKQVNEDTQASGRSIARLVSLIISSEEFRRIPSDIIRFLRSSLADKVSDVGDRIDNVEDALRGPSGHGGGEVAPKKDFSEPDEALREAGLGVQSVIQGVKTDKGKGKQADEKVDVENDIREQVVSRVARLLDTLQSDEQYQNAVQTLLAVSGKYLNLLDKAKESVSTSIEKADGDDEVEKVQALASEGIEQAEEVIMTQIATTHFEAHISAQASHHFVEAVKAAREVLEGLAGGSSTEDIVKKMQRIKSEFETDSALKDWLGDVNDFLTRSIGGKDGSSIMNMNSEEVKDEMNTLYARLQELIQSRPEFLVAIDEFKASCRAFYLLIEGDVALHRIRARVNRIVQMTTLTLWEGVKDIKSKGSQIVSMLINAVIPSIGDVLGSVPIPRVEFTSDNVDAVVEDVVIPVVSLLPDTINLTTMTDWSWKRNPSRKTTQSNLDTNFVLSMRGLRLAVTDVSFYVQERFTAPSTGACFSCCSFGRSQSKWCLCQGPSSWLAYTESALLDVGFWRKGLGVTLDLSDAGQSEDDDRKKTAKKGRGEEGVMWDDDTTSEGKRRHFFHVNKVDVQVDDSFDFKLRESRHWILNGLLRVASKPLIKIVMRRIVSAQIQHAFESVDGKLWDYHYRAKRLALIRDEQNQKWEKQGLPELKRKDIHPSVWEYVSVLVNPSAGKSKARLLLEEKEIEEAKLEKRKEEAEANEQAASTATQTKQPTEIKSMEIKPTSIIKNDVDGNYSLSIGLAPRLLDKSKSGPKTKHIRLRDDLVERNYRKLADRPKQKVLDVYQEVDIRAAATSTLEEVQRGFSVIEDTIHGTQATSRVVAHEQAGKYEDDGWKSEAFTL
ncbi:hypothetical protein CBS101457_001426 [Exobasidium rhododendri]|nr:hypothetical protein CBS101457_001426 [Exobasidium rhododendri]